MFDLFSECMIDRIISTKIDLVQILSSWVSYSSHCHLMVSINFGSEDQVCFYWLLSVEQDDNFLLKADFTFSYQALPDLQLALC